MHLPARQDADRNTRRRGTRAAFTLIELLVVIAIIAVLSAMGAGAYFASVKRAQRSNTTTALLTLDNNILRKHWSQVIEDAKKEDIPDIVVSNLAGGDRNRARTIWIQLRLWEAFPTTFAEISNPNANFIPYRNGYIPVNRKHMYQYQKRYQQALAGNPSGKLDPQAESAACLLLSLSVARGGNKLDRDTLGSSYFRDTNNDGLEEVVDGWGKAIQFGHNASSLNGAQSTYNLTSAGPDEQFGTGDDIASNTLKQ